MWCPGRVRGGKARAGSGPEGTGKEAVSVDAACREIPLVGDNDDSAGTTHARFHFYYSASIGHWPAFRTNALVWPVNPAKTLLKLLHAFAGAGVCMHHLIHILYTLPFVSFSLWTPRSIGSEPDLNVELTGQFNSLLWLTDYNHEQLDDLGQGFDRSVPYEAESKKPSVLSTRGTRSIIQVYLDGDFNVVCSVNQLYTYLHEYKLTYGSLTTLTETWFVRRSRKDRIEIPDVVLRTSPTTDSPPSLHRAILYAWSLTETKPYRRTRSFGEGGAQNGAPGEETPQLSPNSVFSTPSSAWSIEKSLSRYTWKAAERVRWRAREARARTPAPSPTRISMLPRASLCAHPLPSRTMPAAFHCRPQTPCPLPARLFPSNRFNSPSSTHGSFRTTYPSSIGRWDTFTTDALDWQVDPGRNLVNETELNAQLILSYNSLLWLNDYRHEELEDLGEGFDPTIPFVSVKSGSAHVRFHDCKPDAVLQLSAEGQEALPLYLWESKKPSVLALRGARSILSAYRARDLNVVCAVNQLYTYLHEYRLTYGSLTTSTETWFVRRSQKDQLEISDIVMRNSATSPVGPSLRRAILFAWSLIQTKPVFDDHPGFDPSKHGPGSRPFPGSNSGIAPTTSTRTSARLTASRKSAASSSSSSSLTGVAAGSSDEPQESDDSGFAGTPTLLKDLSLDSVELSREVVGYGSMGRCLRGLFEGSPAIMKVLELGKTERGEQRLANEIEAYGALSALSGQAIGTCLGGGAWGALGVLATEEIMPGRVPGVESMDGFDAEHMGLIVASLRLIHDAGYVHGDVRPQNILFSGEGSARKALFIDLESAHVAWEGAREDEMEGVLCFVG
ncbi:hypothetical protein BDK51DRAFT_38292 [Blyttiomyces helicus]|uniref:Uncharacterized protein n=1 Tax=Blyttiomyces helicus TaxID=388810 RepID=A0A4P9WKA7_9FUNG|nr:hypothetical protein BDK51DRAFT_38292 [Blyttiomyces helicus]|eukprot:RKO92832.1 hypothetical protein BDK51DRAFT_38292 [Blyttiomyces helicus]